MRCSSRNSKFFARERRPPSEKASWIFGTKSLSFSSAKEIISPSVESLRQSQEGIIIFGCSAKLAGKKGPAWRMDQILMNEISYGASGQVRVAQLFGASWDVDGWVCGGLVHF